MKALNVLKGALCGLLAAGSASAQTTISIPTLDVNMSALFTPIVELVSQLPGVIFALIGTVIGIVFIVLIIAVGSMVVGIFDAVVANVRNAMRRKY
jgi:hypothetical protein